LLSSELIIIIGLVIFLLVYSIKLTFIIILNLKKRIGQVRKSRLG
jgi:hypothetical protein